MKRAENEGQAMGMSRHLDCILGSQSWLCLSTLENRYSVPWINITVLQLLVLMKSAALSDTLINTYH